MKKIRFDRFLVLALATAICGPALAQRQPHTIFKEKIGLTDQEIQQVESGKVVTKVMESKDKYGQLVVGAVYVNSTVEKLAGVFRDVKKLEEEKVYLAVQRFGENGTPASPDDFKRLDFDKSDIDDLAGCKAGDCDLQIMNLDNLAKFQEVAKGKAPGKYDTINQAVRETAAAGMKRYMQGGLQELGSYRDRKKPLNLYQSTKEMVDSSYYLPKDKALDIYNHVVEFPNGKMQGAEDILYWEKIDFGQGPVVRINHLSLFPKGAGPAKFIAANKQLYASKYMRVGLQMYYCIPDTQQPEKPGFYLIQVNDSRLPDFGGIKLGIVRKVATGKAVEGTADTLAIFKRRSEAK